MNNKEFMDYLKASLPSYNCSVFHLIRIWFSLSSIPQMTTSGHNDSIDQIEQFILKEYPDDPSHHHNYYV